MKLTKVVVDKIEPPVDRDQAFYRDQQLKGFAVTDHRQRRQKFYR